MKTYLLNLVMLSSLFAGTYDNLYSLDYSLKVTNQFMDEKFIEIKRFDAIYEDTSIEDLDKIFKVIKEYIAEGKSLELSLIAYSSDELNIDEAMDFSKLLALNLLKKLEKNGISKKIITLEYRGLKNLGFTTATNYGVSLSNRVMLSMYVIAREGKKKEKEKKVEDHDGDGIPDSRDKCLGTLTDVRVDVDGCPLEKDEVLEYLDDSVETPSGVSINQESPPLDSDKDGILDYQDDCSDTMEGISVNLKGCPIIKKLTLNFAHQSSKIPESSYYKVIDFATYLKENLVYKIQVIGHTDSIGTMAYNQGLSLDRASALKSALIKEGIDEQRIETIDRGELESLQTNRTDAGRTANRRIEVKLFN